MPAKAWRRPYQNKTGFASQEAVQLQLAENNLPFGFKWIIIECE
jgi:hypothetical protein